jgi:biopolymer transport protein ExbD
MPIQRHTEESGETGIDLAPMLDFVLNLLIFFIITTSFVKEAGVEVTRADAETAVHREKGNILIAIRPNGDIWMDRQQVDIRAVRPMIERLHVERPDDSVVIVADKSSKTSVLASVMDAVRAGGIEEMAVAAAGAGGE